MNMSTSYIKLSNIIKLSIYQCAHSLKKNCPASPVCKKNYFLLTLYSLNIKKLSGTGRRANFSLP